MKIAIVVPFAEQKGGAEIALVNLLRQVSCKQHEWLVIFLKSGTLCDQITCLHVRTEIIESGRLRNVFLFCQTVFRLAFLFKEENVDVVVSWATKAHLYAGIASFIARVPSIWYNHDNPDLGSFLHRFSSFLPSKGVLNVSRETSIEQQKFFPHRSTRVVRPGINLEVFNKQAFTSVVNTRTKLKLPTDVPIIGIVGRLQHWKGIHVLIQAMPFVLEKYPSAYCLIVGGKHDLEAEYTDYLKSLVCKYNISERVIMVGQQTNVQEWMHAMDIVIHASKNEPFGLVIVEAMAMGKPVIATNEGGPKEIIDSNLYGTLIPYSDVKSLQKAILNYLDHPSLMSEVGYNALIRAQDFSAEKYASQFIISVQELLI